MSLKLWDEILKDDPIARAVLANPLNTKDLAKMVQLYNQVKQLEQDIQSLGDMYRPNSQVTFNKAANPQTNPQSTDMGRRTWDLVQGLVAAMSIDVTKHRKLEEIMQQSARHICGNSQHSS